VKIHRKLPTLRGGERVEAWVWRITRNALVDHFRRTHPSEPLPAELTSNSEPELDAPDLSPCVRRFVGELPPDYREAWKGLTQQEMAKQLGLSISGAKSRVQRARVQLKEMLLDCCRFELDRRGNVVEMQPRQKKCRAC
jgi:RNA polymerase sigma-70 factor, ECF subfamily